MRRHAALVILVLASASATFAQGSARGAAKDDPARRVAIAYLKALHGTGDGSARELLLGGSTLTADDFTIPNWKIVRRDPPEIEEGDIRAAVAEMRALDKAGRETLNAVVNLDGDSAKALTQAQAEKMMAPTKRRAERFRRAFPVFSYVARVGKDVFWHPSNPWRTVVDELGDKGKYKLVLHRFHIEERAGGKTRVWPLRVLRITTAQYDSGWKVLPASDWDPEY